MGKGSKNVFVESTPKATVNLTVTDQEEGAGSITVKCHVHAIGVRVEHSFGENARFKGRNAIMQMELRPQNAIVEVVLEDKPDSGLGLARLIEQVVSQAIVGVEVAVMTAEEREVEEQERLREEREQAEREARGIQTFR